MCTCKYCGKEFKRPCALGMHERTCKENPDRRPLENHISGYGIYQKQCKNKKINSITHQEKNINENIVLHCKFCGKTYTQYKSHKMHERMCPSNPERNYKNGMTGKPAWNKGLTKDTDERVKKTANTLKENYNSGKIQPKRFSHTEETKKKISEKRKEWLANNKDKHVWKRNTKFNSIPCENFKNFLKTKNICFVSEYEPFEDVNYSIDIAFPNKKIGIEINGNQHYNHDGSLKDYYQNRHNFFESQGWTLYEIHYTKCYNINVNDFQDILNLPIYDKDYVNEYFYKKEIKKKQKLQKIKQKKELLVEQTNKNKKNIIKNLIENSNIDFSKQGWSHKAKQYLQQRGELWNTHIFQLIKKYFPDFLKSNNVWKRKGSKY